MNASKLLGTMFSSERMDTALVNIKQLMEGNGYDHRSTVTPRQTEDPDTQQITIVFSIILRRAGASGTVIAGNRDAGCAPETSPGSLNCGRATALRRTVPEVRCSASGKRYQKQDRLLAQVLVAKKTTARKPT